MFAHAKDLINPFTPEGFPVDERNCLAFDRVKFISGTTGVKGLTMLSQFVWENLKVIIGLRHAKRAQTTYFVHF